MLKAKIYNIVYKTSAAKYFKTNKSSYLDKQVEQATNDIQQLITNDKIYSQIENAIINWSIDGTKTAGMLTREIIDMLK